MTARSTPTNAPEPNVKMARPVSTVWQGTNVGVSLVTKGSIVRRTLTTVQTTNARMEAPVVIWSMDSFVFVKQDIQVTGLFLYLHVSP